MLTALLCQVNYTSRNWVHLILILADRFTRRYLHLANDYMHDEHEPELSIIHFSVQLFTTPSLAEYVIEHSNIIGTILLIMRTMFEWDKDLTESNLVFFDRFSATKDRARLEYSLQSAEKLTCGGPSLTNKKLLHFFLDLNYLFSSYRVRTAKKYPLKAVSSLVIGTSEFKLFFDLLLVWQGMNPQKRQGRAHVEYESEDWVHAFNLSLHIEQLVWNVSRSFWPSKSLTHVTNLLHAISETNDCLLRWSLIDHYKQRGTRTNDGFHTLTLFGGLIVRVPYYTVTCQEVSLHNSIHWFYAHLLEIIPKVLALSCETPLRDLILDQVFGDMETNTHVEPIISNEPLVDLSDISLFKSALSASDRKLLLFDYTIRSFVFVAQIKAGLWVRNGTSLRTQSYHYKEIVLRECSNIDLYLLQFAASVIKPDLFLAMILDRFEVAWWFAPDALTKKHQLYTATRAGTLVQEMLQLLIGILNERARVCAVSVDGRLRREIIHQLAAYPSGIPYSALERRLPEALLADNDPSDEKRKFSVDQILEKVAHFKFQDSSAHGLYILREEYFSEIDPWCWQYTRNQREEVEEILCAKAIIRNEHVYIPPKTHAINPDTGFDRLLSLADSTAFRLIIFFSLYHSLTSIFLIDSTLNTKSTSNTNSAEITLGMSVHLMVVAVGINASSSIWTGEFDMISSSTKLTTASESHISILTLILFALDNAKYDGIGENNPKLLYIVDRLETNDTKSRAIIESWRNAKIKTDFISISSMEHLSAERVAVEKERKKLESKARKDLIMKKFAEAQKDFQINYQADLEEDTVMTNDCKIVENERIVPFPNGSCIYCQEDVVASGKAYGVIGYSQKIKSCRMLDPLDIRNYCRVLNAPKSFDIAIEDPVIGDEIDSTSFSGDQNGCRISSEGKYISSCGHILHSLCFEKLQDTLKLKHSLQPHRNHAEHRGEFLCPICKIISNIFIPVLWSDRKEVINWNGSNLSSASRKEVAEQRINSLYDYIRDVIHTVSLSEIASKDEKSSEFVIRVFNNMPKLHDWSHIDPYEIFESSKIPGSLPSHSAHNFRGIDHLYSFYFYPKIMLDATERSKYEFETVINRQCGISDKILSAWESFYTTINMTEIISRGAQPLVAETNQGAFVHIGILNRVNSSSLTNLVLLAETCKSALIFESDISTKQIQKYSISLMGSIFEKEVSQSDPLMLRDGFANLLRVTLAIFPAFKIADEHIFHWIRIFALSEITRCIISQIEAILVYPEAVYLQIADRFGKSTAENTFISILLNEIIKSLGLTQLQTDKVLQFIRLDHLRSICEGLLLTYARKCVLLLYCRFGMVPPSGSVGFDLVDSSSDDAVFDTTELSRLSLYLQIPAFDFLVEILCAQSELKNLCKNWCGQLSISKEWSESLKCIGTQSVQIEQVLIYQLVKLPSKLEMLFDISLSRSCLNCNAIPLSPAVCLLCGTIVCEQSFCCEDNNVGECNVHMRTCAVTVGIYYIIKKGVILLLHDNKGMFYDPPYLDVHGEIDIGLRFGYLLTFRKGKPQFLNRKRYNDIMKIWVTQNIPSTVARRIDSIIDMGGWRSM